MDITHLIEHPEELNQETLYDLRRLVAIYPAFHAARILFLKNLFLLHDPTFDQELRRAALLVPDRRVLFAITHPETFRPAPQKHKKKAPATDDTTSRLLDHFLQENVAPRPTRRIAADPRTDYMAYIMQEEEETEAATTTPIAAATNTAADADERLDSLISGFIESQSRGITLPENPSVPEGILDDPDELPEEDETQEEEVVTTEKSIGGELTDTLVGIYIKQQKYERAIEMMTKQKEKPSAQANPYYADQLRFLQKLAINKQHLEQKKNNSDK